MKNLRKSILIVMSVVVIGFAVFHGPIEFASSPVEVIDTSAIK